MKKFLFRLAVLAALVAAADALAGVACGYMQARAKYGDTWKSSYVADRMEADVVVFGSSRAVRHYDPRILEDSLGMSCYNCGQEGNGIVFAYGQYRLFRDRHVPRVIVYDVHPPFDLQELDATLLGSDKSQLDKLRPFYDRVDTLFWEVDATERWKMMSRMRRYNRLFVEMASDCVRLSDKEAKGYKPLSGVLDYEPARPEPCGEYPRDGLKMRYWRRLVADCKARGTRLVFAASPVYGGGDGGGLAPLEELARREGIPFLIHCGDSAVAFERRYFHDGNHMNADGAEAYTRIVASELKGLLCDRKAPSARKDFAGGFCAPRAAQP